MSCNIEAFQDVFQNITREAKPTEWRDGSQEMAKMTWIIVAILMFYFSVTKLYDMTLRKWKQA